MLCSIFTRIFSSSQALLISWGHCVHKLSSHKAGIVKVVHARLRCRPAAGRKDTTQSRERNGRAKFDSEYISMCCLHVVYSEEIGQ